MRKGRLLGIGVLGLAAWLAIPPGQAAELHHKADMTGAEEVPGPGDPEGKGTAVISLDDSKNEICYDITYENIAKPTAAHIHTGAKGVAGPPAVTLDISKGNIGCVSSDATTVKAIRDDPGNHYVNLHTADYPKGAIRGQLAKA